ncbi:hypothetical protein ABN097_24400 [Enterobacter cloacae]|uniref:hypothetical protein n=1 Tax=Enterobacter cloacae TaxID=550 RepID=UPI00325AB058
MQVTDLLISSEKLLPLARFYFHHFDFVTTVIRANEPLKSTVDWLKPCTAQSGIIEFSQIMSRVN